MKLQRLYSLTRQAIDHYHLIEDGDHIAVGISGGKDSLTLLYALKKLQRFYPKSFDLIGITINLGFGIQDFHQIKNYCSNLDVDLHIVETQISDIVFNKRKESNPCSLCAKMRKGALNNHAKELGFNTIAYAHHKDDMIETAIMSLLYEGRFHCFSPVTYLDKMELTVIRPLMYVPEADVIGFTKKYELPEKEVIGFANKYQLPIAKNTCPVDGHTKREYIKNLVKTLTKENPDCKNSIFTALCNKSFD